MATNLSSCFSIEFLEQLLKFRTTPEVNFISLKYVKSQRSYGFLIAEELDFWLPNFGFKRSLLSLLNGIFYRILKLEKNQAALRNGCNSVSKQRKSSCEVSHKTYRFWDVCEIMHSGGSCYRSGISIFQTSGTYRNYSKKRPWRLKKIF